MDRQLAHQIARAIRQAVGPRFKSALFNPTRHDASLKILVYLTPLSSKASPEPEGFIVTNEDLDRN